MSTATRTWDDLRTDAAPTDNGVHRVDPARAVWLRSVYFLSCWGAAETDRQREARHAAYRRALVRDLGWRAEDGTWEHRYAASTGELVAYLAGF